jgi:transposase
VPCSAAALRGEAGGGSQAVLFAVQADATLLLAFIGEFDGERGMLLIVFTPHDA